MAETDKLNIDSIISRLLEGKKICVYVFSFWTFCFSVYEKKKKNGRANAQAIILLKLLNRCLRYVLCFVKISSDFKNF